MSMTEQCKRQHTPHSPVILFDRKPEPRLDSHVIARTYAELTWSQILRSSSQTHLIRRSLLVQDGRSVLR